MPRGRRSAREPDPPIPPPPPRTPSPPPVPPPSPGSLSRTPRRQTLGLDESQLRNLAALADLFRRTGELKSSRLVVFLNCYTGLSDLVDRTPPATPAARPRPR